MAEETTEVREKTPGEIKRQEEGEKRLGPGWVWIENCDPEATVQVKGKWYGYTYKRREELGRQKKEGLIEDFRIGAVLPYAKDGKPLYEHGVLKWVTIYIKPKEEKAIPPTTLHKD
jgi:hypothetical protein